MFKNLYIHLVSQLIQTPTATKVPGYEDNKTSGKDCSATEYFIYFNI